MIFQTGEKILNQNNVQQYIQDEQEYLDDYIQYEQLYAQNEEDYVHEEHEYLHDEQCCETNQHQTEIFQ